MLRKEYIFKFYLNAVHATSFFGAMSDSHPHTWEISLHISRLNEEDEQPFHKIEEKIMTFFHIYEGRDLNRIPPFDHQNPTMENIADTFFAQLKNILLQNEWTLNQFMISENPARSYVIQNDVEHEVLFGNQTQTAPKQKEQQEIQEQEPEQNSILDRNNELNAAAQVLPGAMTDEAAAAKSLIDETAAEAEKEWASEEADAAEETGEQAQQPAPPQTERTRPWVWVAGGIGISLLLLICAVLTQVYVNQGTLFPWGSDVWGHLFKGRFLYERLSQGEFYPLYMPEWYNGLQPFRYWPPLTYYILAVFYFFTGGNPYYANILLEILIFFVGAVGFVLWGKRYGRPWLGVLVGILWFFVPDNLRVLYGEGNLPRVIITMMIPLFSYYCWSFIEDGKLYQLVLASFLIALITMSHLMVTAMLGMTVFLVLLVYGLYTKKWRRSVQLLTGLVLGIGTCAVWIVPALQGGIMGQSGAASDTITAFLMRPVTESLNPFYRMQYNDSYYYGLGYILIVLFGLFFAKREKKTGFIIALVIFIGTIDLLFPIISNLPFSQVFWMMRFTPFAMALILISILCWKDAKRWVTAVMVGILVIEGVTSVPFLMYRKDTQTQNMAGYDQAVAATNSRVALMDLSGYDSYPSYYIPRNGIKNTDYVFGWAWQGATTGDNIVELNTALEQENYLFLFDRAVELGADTLIFRKSYIQQTAQFQEAMEQTQYTVIFEEGDQVVCKRELPAAYGTVPAYQGITIGKTADNLIYTFPQMSKGHSATIDDYTLEELAPYQTIFLSGFSYKRKEVAEQLLKDLAAQGKRVVVDINNLQQDLFTRRNTFMGVSAQPISYAGQYPQLVTEEGEIQALPLPEEYEQWNTMYNDNSRNIHGYTVLDGKQIPFWTEKDGIQFVGLNLPYYAAETQYGDILSLVGKIFELTPGALPEREIVPLTIQAEGSEITIESPRDGVLTSLANVDGMKPDREAVRGVHNLLAVNQGTIKVRLTYPHLLASAAGSVLFIGLLIAYFWWLRRKTMQTRKNKQQEVPAGTGGKEMPV